MFHKPLNHRYMKKDENVEMSYEDIVLKDGVWTDRNGVKHRYVDPLSDDGFKIIFGTEGNEELLASLLNTIIPDVRIVNLQYRHTEHLGMIEEDNKAVFDVYCEDEDGVRFLAEMQNWDQHYFFKRAVYYSTYAVQDQAAKEKKHQMKTLGKDSWDYNYAPVYVVCFLSGRMKKVPRDMELMKRDDYISIYRYTDIETHEPLNDGTTLVFIEMKRFRKKLTECSTAKEKWICSMKNMNRQLKMPKELAGTDLEQFYRKAELSAMTPEQRHNYISRFMSRNDELNSRAEQIADAREEGMAKGMAKGMAIGRAETVRKLVAGGMDAGTVAGILGISIEQIMAYVK